VMTKTRGVVVVAVSHLRFFWLLFAELKDFSLFVVDGMIFDIFLQ